MSRISIKLDEKRWRPLFDEMKKGGCNISKRDTQSKPKGELKLKIKDMLGVHEATESEINQVYDHILMEMLV